jgi:hypothetical protein
MSHPNSKSNATTPTTPTTARPIVVTVADTPVVVSPYTFSTGAGGWRTSSAQAEVNGQKVTVQISVIINGSQRAEVLQERQALKDARKQALAKINAEWKSKHS